jgi:hypothetical protein
MREYVQNIIPRLLKYSTRLDRLEVFVEKSWVYIDEDNNKHQYIFERSGELHMSLNGIVKTGSWKLLTTNQLLINRLTDKILLEHVFVQDALLVLKLADTENTPFILINKQQIPDLNVEAYLDQYEATHELTPNSSSTGYILLESNQIKGDSFYINKVISFESGILLTGVYRVARSNEMYIDLANNRIKRVYFLNHYKYGELNVSIEQNDPFNLQEGDKVVEGKLPVGVEVQLKNNEGDNLKITINEQYVITSARSWGIYDTIFWTAIACIVIAILVIIIRN